MLIRTFIQKVIDNERKFLTNPEIIEQICGFIRTYGGGIPHLLIHLSSVTFVS